MIAKITKGTSHAGTVNYVMRKDKDPKLLDSGNVLAFNAKSIIDAFVLQCRMRPDVRNVVGHISLSFSIEDCDRITDDMMRTVAAEYMRRMHIVNTQYILVRHHDRRHPHCHLVYNRIDNEGKVITDRNDRIRSIRICKELTAKYNLHMASGKNHVNRDRLRPSDAARYRLYDIIMHELSDCRSWQSFRDRLERQGVRIRVVTNGSSDRIQGIKFEYQGQWYNGSTIDRQCSYSKLDYKIRQNAIPRPQKAANTYNGPQPNQWHSGETHEYHPNGTSSHGEIKKADNDTRSDDSNSNGDSLNDIASNVIAAGSIVPGVIAAILSAEQVTGGGGGGGQSEDLSDDRDREKDRNRTQYRRRR